MPTQAFTQIPADVISAADYARYAQQHLSPPLWAYLEGGAADELSVAANRDAWSQLELVPRMLRDLRGGHSRCQVLGTTLAQPLMLAPVAYHALYHPAAECAVAEAAALMGVGMALSSYATTAMETVAQVGPQARWFQLYWQGSLERTLALAERAHACGYQALLLTVDAPVSGPRNRQQRAGFVLPASCQAVNLPDEAPPVSLQPGQSVVFDALLAHAPTWSDVRQLCAAAKLPVLLKGILHPDDALEAMRAGALGVVLSNHGGRVLDTAVSPARMLTMVRARLGDEALVLVDGGIRRGTDVLKAIALGADAVLIGRPYIHALACAGALGVAHLLRLLHEELELAMAACGVATLDQVTADLLARHN